MSRAERVLWLLGAAAMALLLGVMLARIVGQASGKPACPDLSHGAPDTRTEEQRCECCGSGR